MQIQVSPLAKGGRKIYKNKIALSKGEEYSFEEKY
jgi:hypothetical protein